MVRPESWTSPVGASPTRVGTGAPGSRPQSVGETRRAGRGGQGLVGGRKAGGRGTRGTPPPGQRNNDFPVSELIWAAGLNGIYLLLALIFFHPGYGERH